jgi:capsular polysaccharide transport system permease protein
VSAEVTLSELAAAARLQGRVIGALMLRETRTRFGKTQIGYLWALLEPIGLISIFVLIALALGTRPAVGDDFGLFFAVSMLPFMLSRRITNFVGHALDANRALLSFPIVREIDTMIARGLLEFATGLVVIAIILGAIIVYSNAPLPTDIAGLMMAIAVLSMLGFGLGLINAVMSIFIAAWRQIEPMIGRVLFMISGIFFVPDALPRNVLEYLAWNPYLHGVEWARQAYYLNYRSSVLDPGYLAAWAIAALLIGLAMERVSRISGEPT